MHNQVGPIDSISDILLQGFIDKTSMDQLDERFDVDHLGTVTVPGRTEPVLAFGLHKAGEV